jgi:type 1 glutamine amidotransferase
MNRRDMLIRSGATALTLGLSRFPQGWTAPLDGSTKKVLMFTRSQGFEHDVIKRKGKPDSLAERIVKDLAKKHNFDVTCTKDGREFLPETIAKYDAFLFETTMDLTKEGGDGQPPMPVEGKKAFLDAIAKGKGFVGCHCATDTFHSPGYPGNAWKNQSKDEIDPYIAMIGGEFISHGAQQKAKMHVVDDAFPATAGMHDFTIQEEWYSLKNFAPDLHVLIVQETMGMHDAQYERPAFPETWARMHGQGRVFYTSLGHRDDVWESPRFQNMLVGALSWAVGNVNADVTPNLEKVAPQAMVMPKEPPPRNKKKK